MRGGRKHLLCGQDVVAPAAVLDVDRLAAHTRAPGEMDDRIGARKCRTNVGTPLADIGNEVLATRRQPIDPYHPLGAVAHVVDELAADETAGPRDHDHAHDARRARALK